MLLDPNSTCPTCTKTLDAFTSADLDDARPKPSDVSVCAYCGELLEYQSDLTLQKLTAEKQRQLYKEDSRAFFRLVRAQRYVKCGF